MLNLEANKTTCILSNLGYKQALKINPGNPLKSLLKTPFNYLNNLEKQNVVTNSPYSSNRSKYSIIRTISKKHTQYYCVEKVDLPAIACILYNDKNKENYTSVEEVLDVSQPFIFHIDIEFKKDVPENMIQYTEPIIQTLKEIVESVYGIEQFSPKVILTGSTDVDQKHHIVVSNLVICNGDSYSKLMSQLTEQLIIKLGKNPIYDQRYTGYKQTKHNKFMNLRLLGATKNGIRKKEIKYSNYEINKVDDVILTTLGLNDPLECRRLGKTVLPYKILPEDEKKVANTREDIVYEEGENVHGIPTKTLDEAFLSLKNYSKGADYQQWINLCWAVYNHYSDTNHAIDVIHKVSEYHDTYNYNVTEKLINSITARKQSFINALPVWLKIEGELDMRKIILQYIHAGTQDEVNCNVDIVGIFVSDITLLDSICDNINPVKIKQKDIDLLKVIIALKEYNKLASQNYNSLDYWNDSHKKYKCNNDITEMFNVISEYDNISVLEVVKIILEASQASNNAKHNRLLNQILLAQFPAPTTQQLCTKYLQSITKTKGDKPLEYKDVIPSENISTYLSDIVKPYSNDKKIEYVRSAPNTQKSFSLKQYIHKNKGKSVLIVLGGRALCSSLSNSFKETDYNTGEMYDLGFDLYSEMKTGPLTSNRLICEYESLHRVSRAKYDIVVCDEIASIYNNTISSTTNGTNLTSNFNNMEHYISHSNKVLFMSADISPELIRDVNSAFGLDIYKQECYLQNNMHNPMHKYSCRVDTRKKLTVYFEIEDRLKKGEKISISSTCKKTLNKLQSFLSIDTGKMYLYSGDVSDDDKKTILQEKDGVNSRIYTQLFMYTPAITVGVDFNRENHFDVHYHFSDTKSLSAENQVQLLRRVRHLKSKEYIIVISAWNPMCLNKTFTTNQATQERICDKLNKKSVIEDEILESEELCNIQLKQMSNSFGIASLSPSNEKRITTLDYSKYLVKIYVQSQTSASNKRQFLHLLMVNELFKTFEDRISFLNDEKDDFGGDIDDDDNKDKKAEFDESNKNSLEIHNEKLNYYYEKIVETIQYRIDTVTDHDSRKTLISQLITAFEFDVDDSKDDKMVAYERCRSLYPLYHCNTNILRDINVDLLVSLGKVELKFTRWLLSDKKVSEIYLEDVVKIDPDIISSDIEQNRLNFDKYFVMKHLLDDIGLDLDFDKSNKFVIDEGNISGQNLHYIKEIEKYKGVVLTKELLSNIKTTLKNSMGIFGATKTLSSDTQVIYALNTIIGKFMGMKLVGKKREARIDGKRTTSYTYSLVLNENIKPILKYVSNDEADSLENKEQKPKPVEKRITTSKKDKIIPKIVHRRGPRIVHRKTVSVC